MKKNTFILSAVALTAMACLISCNNNNEATNDSISPEPTEVQATEATPAENADPEVSYLIEQKGAKAIVTYNYMDSFLEIIMKYEGSDYMIFPGQLTDAASARYEELFAPGTPNHEVTLKGEDLVPGLKLSELTKM